MKQKLLSFIVLCTLIIGVSHAQNRTVTGRVTSAEDRSPLAGVSVYIQGSNLSTQTDSQGNYSINASVGSQLTFSFVGFESTTKHVRENVVIDVVLEKDDDDIDEVVVIGYGTGRSMTNIAASVATVTTKQIKDRPRANVLESLQGQVAGLQVFTSSGEPTATQSIRLRGVGSLGASSTPLFVLDGIPVEHSSILAMNPEDFESVTVLKDAAATSVYGSRAANGVIYLTSKKGTRKETADIKVRSQLGWSNLAQTKMFQENMMTSQELLDYWIETGYRTQEQVNTLRETYPHDFEWFRYYYKQDRPLQQHDINLTGGSEKTHYYLSAGFYDEEGLMYRSGYDRITLRSNIDTRLNDWARIGVNLAGSIDNRQSNGWGSNNLNGGLSLLAPPFYTPYREDGSEYYGEIIPGLGLHSPNYLADMNPSQGKRNSFTPTAYLQLTPYKGFTFKTQAGMDYNYTRWTSGRVPSYVASPANGASSEEYYSNLTRTWTNTLEYKWKVADIHHFTALAGQEVIDFDYEQFSASSSGQTDDRLTLLPAGPANRNVGQSKSEWAFSSLFGTFAYDIDDKYFLNASIRQDKSSRFGRDREAATFWSLGGMWNLARESFMDNAPWVRDLQLRASYGTTGNASIGNYQHLATVGTAIYDGSTAWGISAPGNPLLGWEKQSMYNIGLSGLLLDRSLSFNVEYYYKNTTDMLLSVPYPFTTGFSDIYDNVGSMFNRGVDVELSYQINIGNEASITPRLTYNYNENRVTELFQDRDYWVIPNTGVAYIVGQPVSYFYPMRASVNTETGLQQWYVPGEDNMITNADPNNVTTTFSEGALQQNTGLPRYAPHTGGFGVDASYKGFTISAHFAYSKDKYLLNNDRYFFENPAQFAGYNQSNTILDYWKEPGDVAKFPKFGEVNRFDSGLIEDASFLRMKNLTIAYSLPRSIAERSNFFKSARIFYVGRNLWTTTKYLGPDPEVDSNIGLGTNPNTRQSTIGLELLF